MWEVAEIAETIPKLHLLQINVLQRDPRALPLCSRSTVTLRRTGWQSSRTLGRSKKYVGKTRTPKYQQKAALPKHLADLRTPVVCYEQFSPISSFFPWKRAWDKSRAGGWTSPFLISPLSYTLSFWDRSETFWRLWRPGTTRPLHTSWIPASPYILTCR